jgi:uncharacterized protein
LLPAAPGRIESLDLIRGVAVLGILAVNIAGFAGPPAATVTPHIPRPGSPADEVAFAATFVLFEGKMRVLFTLLFGASLALFIERAEATGRDGEVLQLRRLGWLLVFGAAHYFLFWWGDILFVYALGGIAVLFLRDLPSRVIVPLALVAFVGWHLAGAAESLGALRAEEAVRLRAATAEQARNHAAFLTEFARRAGEELAEVHRGFFAQIGIKLSQRPFHPIEAAWPTLGETVPIMLIGMALQQNGFFRGEWPSRRTRALAAGGLAAGLAITLPILSWLWQRGFPPMAMNLALLYWTALPHLAMALAYAALLVLAAPRLIASRLGRRVSAAGRMAFSNYIGTTAVMTAIFYGWGLGLAGSVGRAGQLAFVALGWALMLGWSAPWLRRFRQGPLEWLWRSLVERRAMPFRR